ncbi:chitinase [Colletotrichum salicis]|uniref:Chitinase n=1 Tax=Colletotrichum salicis TaxID=1209931 RepID=A0A135UCE5_9PEZI|nr:chitinase [Colletotrichum salicis]
MVTELGDESLDVSQAGGLLSVTGLIDPILTVGGIGEVDLDKTNIGNPVSTSEKGVKHRETSVDAGDGGTDIDLSPSYTINYSVGPFNDMDGERRDPQRRLLRWKSPKRVSALIPATSTPSFPTTKGDKVRINEQSRLKSKIFIPEDNVLYVTAGLGGRISMGGVYEVCYENQVLVLVVAVNYGTMTEFTFIHGRVQHPVRAMRVSFWEAPYDKVHEIHVLDLHFAEKTGT